MELAPFLKNSVSHALIISLICMLLAWYANYHWKRRRLYQMAAQRKGPLALPFIGNTWYFSGSTTDIFNNFMRLSKEFESPAIMWFGPKLYYAIWTPNDMQTILNSPHALEKTDLYRYVRVVTGTGMFAAPVPLWKERRKIIMPTMNQKILNGFVEVFSENSEILVKQLKKEVGKGTFNIENYLGRCSLDMVCQTAMGVTTNAQTTESNFYKWVNRALEIVVKRMFGTFYQFDIIFNRTSMAKEQFEAVENIRSFTSYVITEKKMLYRKKIKESKERANEQFPEEPSKNSFLQELIEISEKGANLTDEQILDEVKTFMIGATESTLSASGFIFILLGMFPDIQDKVYKEVIDVLGTDRLVEHADLEKLQYLERVIKETLRIFPIGQFASRDIAKDIKLESCTIPAGSSVMILFTPAHRNPKVWPNPLKFDPDRFLPEEIEKRHPYSWIPFIGGLRKCIGATYATMVVKVVIATVIRKYQFSTDYKNIEDIKLKADLALKPADGFKVSLQLRESN